MAVAPLNSKEVFVLNIRIKFQKYGVMKFIGIKNANETAIQKIKRVRDGALIKREGLEE